MVFATVLSLFTLKTNEKGAILCACGASWGFGDLNHAESDGVVVPVWAAAFALEVRKA